jgi:hypothetical protein
MEYEEKLSHEAYNISKRAFRGRGSEFLTLQHGFMVHETLPSPTNPMAGLMPPCNNHCESHYNCTADTVAPTLLECWLGRKILARLRHCRTMKRQQELVQ